MTAYYNEHDPFAAAWLRELIKDDLIAPGEVDERSIEDVTPNDLRPFRQCHFFAGIGVWSLAARHAGFNDDAPLWSGSCPCQPFSAAGKGGGFTDERHLWPAFHYLIEQCRPPLVVGEQVAGADGDAWFDLVSADLDATLYAFGAAETVAAGFGAPHKRSRNYWVAYPDGDRLAGRDDARLVVDSERSGLAGSGRALGGAFGPDGQAPACGAVGELADAEDGYGGRGECRAETGTRPDSVGGRGPSSGGVVGKLDDALGIGRTARGDDNGEHDGFELGATGEHGSRGVADSDGGIERDGDAQSSGQFGLQPQDGGFGGPQHRGAQSGLARELERPGPTNGYWRDADWLRCRDERWRAIEPGTFPLVDAGTFRNRVGLLRGAGNAITLGQATGFLVAVRYALKLG